jgi:hypothetical protein
MDRLIKYIKIAYWVIVFFILLSILYSGTDQIVRLILRKNLHIYFSGLEEVITICVVIALIGYWYNLTERNTKYINLLYDINEHYKIIQQLSKEKESEKISGYEFFKLIGMEMNINRAIERRNKSLWWYSPRKKEF